MKKEWKLSQNNKLTIIISVLLIGFVFYKKVVKKHEIDKYKGQTICRILRYEKTGKGGRIYQYEYIVNGKKYKANIDTEGNGKEYKKRYFITEYSRRKPEISRISFDKEITDTIILKKYGFEINPPEHRNPLNYNLVK